jgi:hypothetical protein
MTSNAQLTLDYFSVIKPPAPDPAARSYMGVSALGCKPMHLVVTPMKSVVLEVTPVFIGIAG